MKYLVAKEIEKLVKHYTQNKYAVTTNVNVVMKDNAQQQTSIYKPNYIGKQAEYNIETNGFNVIFKDIKYTINGKSYQTDNYSFLFKKENTDKTYYVYGNKNRIVYISDKVEDNNVLLAIVYVPKTATKITKDYVPNEGFVIEQPVAVMYDELLDFLHKSSDIILADINKLDQSLIVGELKATRWLTITNRNGSLKITMDGLHFYDKNGTEIGHYTTDEIVIGDSNHYLKYSNGNLDISGTISASTGTIGGWTIGQTALSSDSVVLDSLNSKITAGSITIDGQNNSFSVQSKLVYNGNTLTVNGVINSSSGNIAGWEILPNTLSSGDILLDSSLSKITAGSIVINGTSNIFSVQDKLVYNGNTLTIDGVITATTGNIGGWSVGQTELKSNNGFVSLDQSNNRLSFSDTALRIALGYLGGITYTTALGTISTFTTSDYGLYIRKPNAIHIESDNQDDSVVTFNSGDWLVQHNATIKIVNSDTNPIVQLGQVGTTYGLFLYNSLGTTIGEFNNSGINFNNKLIFTGNTLSIDGKVVSTSGSIGGWEILPNTLSSGDILLDSQNSKITAGSITIDGQNNEFKIADKLTYIGSTLTVKGELVFPSGSTVQNYVDTKDSYASLKLPEGSILYLKKSLLSNINQTLPTGYDRARLLKSVQIEGYNVVAGAITTTHISDNQVTTPKLVANAVTADKINVQDLFAQDISVSGQIHNSGKSVYTSTTAGFWLGLDSGTAKFNIGDGNNYLKWTGSSVVIKGELYFSSGSTVEDYVNRQDNYQALTLPKEPILYLDTELMDQINNTLPNGYDKVNLIDKLQVDGTNIMPNAITTTHISDNAITTPKIVANAITADKIQAGAITTDKLYANAVTADKINVDDLFAQNIDLTGNISIKSGTTEIVKIGNDALGTGSPGMLIDGGNLQVNGTIKATYIDLPALRILGDIDKPNIQWLVSDETGITIGQIDQDDYDNASPSPLSITTYQGNSYKVLSLEDYMNLAYGTPATAPSWKVIDIPTIDTDKNHTIFKGAIVGANDDTFRISLVDVNNSSAKRKIIAKITYWDGHIEWDDQILDSDYTNDSYFNYFNALYNLKLNQVDPNGTVSIAIYVDVTDYENGAVGQYTNWHIIADVACFKRALNTVVALY